MKIAGLERCSFVDWPGMMTAVVFTPGCNLRCYYCHNADLVKTPQQGVPPDGVLTWLQSRLGFLDGVVISGGEPLIHQDLADFILALRDMGFQVKLDTNGTFPDALNSLLEHGLLDYVAMDIKAPRRLYNEVCGCAVAAEKIDRSIAAIMALAPEYEFRTTVLPDFNTPDILEVAQRIAGAQRFILQQVRLPAPSTGHPVPREASSSASVPRFTMIQRMAEAARDWVTTCETRGLQIGTCMPAELSDVSPCHSPGNR